MGKLNKQIFCFLFCCWCLSEAAEDERQAYIVYMGALRSSNYSNKLQEQHLQMLQEVVDDSFPSNALIRSYNRSFNGFAAYLTKQEQQKLARHDEVVLVLPSITYRPQTTRSWAYMGLPENTIGNTNRGSDIIIGVLDSGIWPESDSFSDKGFGPVPRKWKGVCRGGKNFTCNKKLIGARFYSSGLSTHDSARDTTGHGTHVASTAAGNFVKDASFYGIAQGTARGGVPSARIAAYKVCRENFICDGKDVLAAFDDAIADGVDIIIISLAFEVEVGIKGDVSAIGSFHAMEKGILTVQSAGNYGSAPGKVASVAPWVLTVGASNMDLGIVTKVALGNGKTFFGRGVNSFKMNGTNIPLVYGKDVTRKCDEKRARSCTKGCVDPSLVRGKILLCDSSGGIEEALRSGAVGLITTSGSEPDVVPLPASHISSGNLKLVQHYVNSTKGATAFIFTSQSVKNTNAPTVASMSARGPNPIIPNVLKPDITAPGVDILAAFSPRASVSSYPADKRSVMYAILSGTSMACPHAAGAAAYVKLAHPDWSPSVIKSALMTTAWEMDPTRDKYKEFSYGSGHINPVKAINPGLVYETDSKDYMKMMCKTGYMLEIIKRFFSCSNSRNVVSNMKDINYPAMTYRVRKNARISVTFSRTVTNVGLARSTYKAKIRKTSDINITVQPETLSFNQLNEKKSFVVTVKGDRLRSMISASLIWSDGVHHVRSPIALY